MSPSISFPSLLLLFWCFLSLPSLRFIQILIFYTCIIQQLLSSTRYNRRSITMSNSMKLLGNHYNSQVSITLAGIIMLNNNIRLLKSLNRWVSAIFWCVSLSHGQLFIALSILNNTNLALLHYIHRGILEVFQRSASLKKLCKVWLPVSKKT